MKAVLAGSEVGFLGIAVLELYEVNHQGRLLPFYPAVASCFGCNTNVFSSGVR